MFVKTSDTHNKNPSVQIYDYKGGHIEIFSVNSLNNIHFITLHVFDVPCLPVSSLFQKPLDAILILLMGSLVLCCQS